MAIASTVPCLIPVAISINVVDNTRFRCLFWSPHPTFPCHTQYCQQNFRDSRSESQLGNTSRSTRGANAGLRKAAGLEAFAALSSYRGHFPIMNCVSVSFWVGPRFQITLNPLCSVAHSLEKRMQKSKTDSFRVLAMSGDFA